MKLMTNILKTSLANMMPDKAILCDHVHSPDGMIPLPAPIISTEMSCKWCEGVGHFCPFVNPSVSVSRSWLCANVHCDVYKRPIDYIPNPSTYKSRRALEWVKFCELNGIGDVNYDVKFENIDQATAKVSYLLKFATTPKGLILMRGDTGTGKTYCSMAVCELFTRTNTSALFCTQQEMSMKWLDSDVSKHFIDKVKQCELLVVDDFGIGDIAPGFMKVFMHILNDRLQWSNRGTIISTNLNDKVFNEFCGEALSDRILTGQLFEFKGKTKRKKTIL